MGYIKSIKIKDELNNYKFNLCEDVISKISKVNIFIGSNNSGKSRLLRGLFLDKELKFNIGSNEIEQYNTLIESFNEEIKEVFETVNSKIVSIGGLSKECGLEKVEYLTENSNITQLFYNRIESIKKVKRNDNITFTGSTGYGADLICEKLKNVENKYIEEFQEKELDKLLAKKTFNKIYIPILRGLRKLGENDDILLKRTVKDYFEQNDDIEVFTGQNLYDDVLKLLCGDFKDRNHLREFEAFLGDNFFNGKGITLIPKIGSDVLFVKIGEEKEQPIYNLGDGIQSIIILTFNLFSNKGNDVLFFIEEPELYLHPGLQRKIIDIFLDKDFDTYQYFITSHSNHLLDLTLDINEISIYKFNKEIEDGDESEKNARFIIENVKNDDTSVLQLLGVNNSSIFLSNCTIWVEGITDRLYLRKYLEIYQKEKFKTREIDKIYSEDLHYSFLEYSGGNITHWDFLSTNKEELVECIKHDRICNKIFLIADSDGAKKGSKKFERHETLKEFFGEHFYCLKAKEIENILMPHILKGVVNKFKDARVNDGGDKDGSLFAETKFSITDYRNQNIGKFIDDKINEKIEEKKVNDETFNYKKRKEFKNGNTINKKLDFCKYAIYDMKSINDMSEDAIELCEKIYNFIKENN